MTGRELKGIIKERKLTQDEAAKIIGVSRVMVNRWCSGKSPICAERKFQILIKLGRKYPSGEFDLGKFCDSRNFGIKDFAEYYGVSCKMAKAWLSGKKSLPKAIQEIIAFHERMRGKFTAVSKL